MQGVGLVCHLAEYCAYDVLVCSEYGDFTISSVKRVVKVSEAGRSAGSKKSLNLLRSFYLNLKAKKLIFIIRNVEHELTLRSSGIYISVIRFLVPLVISDEQLTEGL